MILYCTHEKKFRVGTINFNIIWGIIVLNYPRIIIVIIWKFYDFTRRIIEPPLFQVPYNRIWLYWVVKF